MQFTVRALDASQEVRTLQLEALDETDAMGQARAQRLVPLSAVPRGWLTSRRESFPLLLFAQELSALVAAGLSVVESLEGLLDKESHAARRAVLSRLAARLREGSRLSDALRAQPEVFPPLFVGLIQAAEGTSDIPHSLSRFVAYESRMVEVRHKVTSAAVYPAILLVVGSAVTAFLLGYVVPRFASVYQGSGRTLPWASQMLMQWGDFVQRNGTPLLGGVLAMTVFGYLAWQRKRAAGWSALLALMPAAASRLHVLQLSRLYLTLGMLVDGGIPLHEALRLSSGLSGAGSPAALDAVRHDIEGGMALSDALDRHGLTTPVSTRLLRVGERSGQLGAMLTRAAAFHEEEASRWIERFSKAFEPVLMAAIGIVIGLIVVLLYMPIFELAGSLQ
ncbi:MAG: type II secretion system F family protein [Burkholderiales bacterium]|nr:type II secretion system F family protein [Burkholderiales bacterium]